jgi:hypothetical protein
VFCRFRANSAATMAMTLEAAIARRHMKIPAGRSSPSPQSRSA